ncbi:MFS transporter [Tessaracoccus rhinocerotis]|uniref:MFS transporter n=1 Tax=Tessaracoccus rhinocerotis TaxID=1689449 RepID=UPI00163DD696|nr:MFS transporter [Tessaracoccus rhinocerotis]
MTQNTAARRAAGEITVRERLTFAAGDVFAGGASSLIAVMYLIFLTDVIRLAPGLAGTAVLVAKLWDAVNDPLMGAISDRVRTRMGRRRPFILGGAVLLIPIMALLWLPFPVLDSQLGKMAWAMLSYIGYNTVQTVMAVPYASMSTEITTDYDERNKVNTTRLLFSTVASATVTLLGAWLFDQYRSGEIGLWPMYLAIVLGFGTVFMLVMLGVALFTRERAPIPPRAQRFEVRTFVAPLRTSSFRKLLGMYLSQALAFDIISATVLYYALYVVVGANSQVFLGIFIGVNVIAYPIVTWLVGRVSKHRVYMRLIPLALVGAAAVAVFPGDGPVPLVYVFAFMLAAGMAGAQLMCWVMFPDVLDDAELATGQRNAGSYSGLMTFTRGIASAIVIQALGLVLQFSGYVAPVTNEVPLQPDSAVLGIRLFMWIGITALLVLGWTIARRYPLTRTVALSNQAELDRRRGKVVSGEELA